jgi:deoxyribose-phosphate aldolase
MKAITPIQEADLEFDHGTFDAAAFAALALAGWQSLASVIDHTLLHPVSTRAQVERLCEEAERYRFASVRVHPVWASSAVNLLSGTGVEVGAVTGSPFGASLVSSLRHEAAALARLGVRELDTVLPVGLLKSGNYCAVEHTLEAVASAAHHHGAVLTVILETSLLTMQEKLRAVEIAIQAGADFLRTSTGLSADGAAQAALAPDVSLLRGVSGARCGISASGGIDSLALVRAVLEAGANRIATPDSVAILRELGAQ